jgi:hypothetical protein
VFVTNHVLSGALVGRLAERRPVAAFVAGIASHLVLDAVPHWGCDFHRPGGREHFLAVAKRDGLLGLTAMAAVALTVERSARTATLAAMAGAVLLDLDKPFVHFFGRNPFPYAVRRLHARVQNESPSGMPNEIGFGLAFAALDVAAAMTARRSSFHWVTPDAMTDPGMSRRSTTYRQRVVSRGTSRARGANGDPRSIVCRCGG